MFKDQKKTNFPPSQKTVMIWDGQCGFCHYWIIRWKIMTGDRIDYKTFQKSAHLFPDIPLERFREAVRLVEPDGRISSGPAAAFRSFYLVNKFRWLHKAYCKLPLFKNTNDLIYQFIADHRKGLYPLSLILFGRNPRKWGYNWILFLLIPVLIILFIVIL